MNKAMLNTIFYQKLSVDISKIKTALGVPETEKRLDLTAKIINDYIREERHDLNKAKQLADTVKRVLSEIERENALVVGQSIFTIHSTIKNSRTQITEIVRKIINDKTSKVFSKFFDFEFPFDIHQINPVKVNLIALKEWKTNKLIDIDSIKYSFDDLFADLPKTTTSFSLANALQTIANNDNKTAPWNGRYYRIMKINVSNETFALNFTTGHYFDYLDQCETFLWQLAAFYSHEKDESANALILENELAKMNVNLMDLTTRSTPIGCNCLCVVACDQPYFFMHTRNNTVEATNMSHVIPSGTHQPWTSNDLDRKNEINIINTLIRELFEELLCVETVMDTINKTNRPITTVSELYDELGLSDFYNNLYNQIDAKFFLTGFGFDLVTTKLEGLFVIVIKKTSFDKARKAAVTKFGIGSLKHVEGEIKILEFSKKNLLKLLENGSYRDEGTHGRHFPILAAGMACLSQTYRYFDDILKTCKELNA